MTVVHPAQRHATVWSWLLIGLLAAILVFAMVGRVVG
jgi:hypothetical protein